MKTMLLTLLISMIFLVNVQAQGNSSFFVTDTIPTSGAKAHLGEYYTFCDEITYIQTFDNLRDKPTLITLNEGQDALTLVIYESDAAKFEQPVLELLKVGDRICVQGQITTFQGDPRIEIGTSKQIVKTN